MVETNLSDALARLADDIERNPGTVTGEKITVTAGPGGGNVIGSKIEVHSLPGHTGTVIGKSITVSSGDRNADELAMIKELRQAASDARTGPIPGSWVQSLLDRAGQLANAAITAATRGAVEAIINT